MATLAELQAQYANLAEQDSFVARQRRKAIQSKIAAMQAQAAQATQASYTPSVAPIPTPAGGMLPPLAQTSLPSLANAPVGQDGVSTYSPDLLQGNVSVPASAPAEQTTPIQAAPPTALQQYQKYLQDHANEGSYSNDMGTFGKSPQQLGKEAFDSLPDGMGKYEVAAYLRDAEQKQGISGDFSEGGGGSTSQIYVPVDYLNKISNATAQLAKSNDPRWEAALNAYNTGQPVPAAFQDEINKYRNYYREGQAEPGKLTQETITAANTQWAQDVAQSPLDRAAASVAGLGYGFLGGTVGSAVGGPIGGMLGGAAAAGAWNSGNTGSGVGSSNPIFAQIGGAVGASGVGVNTTGQVTPELGYYNSPETTMPLNEVPMYNAPIVDTTPVGTTDYTAPVGLESVTPPPQIETNDFYTSPSGYTPPPVIPNEFSMPLESVPMYNAPIAEAAPVAATNLGQYAAPVAVTTGGMLESSALIPAATQTVAPATGGLLTNAANTVIPAATNWWESPQAWSTGLNMLGGYLQGEQATQAAQTSANAQIEAARIAAEAAKFKPVGVTSRFGQSQFGYDDKGNLISAGYNLSPEAKAQQDILMGVSGNMLSQYQGAQAATAPMGTAGQQAMALGQGYLGTSPQAQAAQYMAQQQALLAPSREREMAALQARLQAQGRGGLAVGGTSSGMMAANPELEAYYNAIRQQDLGLAAQATQGGMDYAKFGAGMVGAGGDLISGMYGTQAAAYKPYQTALGGATTLEGLGQNPMDLGINIGAKGTAASAMSGQLLGQGMANAATTMQPANAYSPWVGLLSGGANMIGQYNKPQPQPQQNQWGK